MQFRILVTSSKGGVGKSTTSLLLALSLAKRGKRVLLCDCDIGSRCLDMLLGIEDEVVYDIGDVYGGNVSAERAIIRPDGRGGLMFCAASLSLSVSEMKAEKLCGALDALAEASDADFVICDTAGSAIPDMIAGGFANLALVCTTQQPASVRSAEATAIRLRAAGLASIRLVLTSFEFREASRRERSGILEIIDASSLRAIGAVPFDRDMLLAQEKGALPTGRSAALQAYDNIAARLCGEDTKLFYKIRGISSGRAL